MPRGCPQHLSKGLINLFGFVLCSFYYHANVIGVLIKRQLIEAARFRLLSVRQAPRLCEQPRDLPML